MVYFDATKLAEVKRKWKGARPRASVRFLCEAIAEMEVELRALPKE